MLTLLLAAVVPPPPALLLRIIEEVGTSRTGALCETVVSSVRHLLLSLSLSVLLLLPPEGEGEAYAAVEVATKVPTPCLTWEKSTLRDALLLLLR